MDCCLLECALKVFEGTYLDDLVPYIMEDNHVEDNIRPDSKTTHYPYLKGLWQSPPRHLPIDVIGRLRFDTIYSPLLEPVARWPEASRLWKWADVDGLAKETWLDDESTRFEFTGWGRGVLVMIELNKENLWRSWLSQSSCMFDALEVTEHRERFFMVCPPVIWLQSIQDEYDAYEGPFGPPDPLEEIPVVYLFLYPPPMTVSELIHSASGHTHFWSFDENGQSKIPREEWTRWYLPALIPRTAYGTSTRLCTWPTHIYTALRDWQIARGFAPSTSDWARSMGYPEFEVIGAGKKKGRFEEHSEAVEPQPKVVQGAFLNYLAGVKC
ncbi:hypothetical protein MPER_08938 [Moniliophthora perniciosa FA553]|nr:hypothetical protein MPER_08938 [Moniliophthora perniciosa FA553]